MRPGAIKAALAMAGIFLAGAIAGGMAGVAWVKYKTSRISAQEFVDRQLRRRVDQLELTPEQVDRIKPIMKEHEEVLRGLRRKAFGEMGQVFREMNARIEGELTAEQLTRFKEIQEAERERFERHMQSRGRRPGGEGDGRDSRGPREGRPPPPPDAGGPEGPGPAKP